MAEGTRAGGSGSLLGTLSIELILVISLKETALCYTYTWQLHSLLPYLL